MALLRDRRVEELAGAVLDGFSIDWTAASAGADPHDRALIERLQLVAAIAEVHRPGDAGTAPPQTWGHLQVREPIGRGAFGQVYRAWDPRLDRDVALKLLPANAVAAASAVIEEGRLLARVRHPNVVIIHGADRCEGCTGLWMELIEGPSLADLVRQGGPLPVCDVVQIGIELARAVAAVHQAGLLHRDIKAQNVVRAADGRVVLMDFGTGLDRRYEEQAALAGTPLYLAPELLAGGEATVESDIYCLGVLLYFLLTGSYPTRAASLDELRRAHAEGEQPRPMTRPGVPPRLAQAIDCAMAREPHERYRSAEDLADALAPSASAPRMLPWVAGALVLIVSSWGMGVLRDPRPKEPVPGDHQVAIPWTSGPLQKAAPLRSVAVLPFKPLVPAEANQALQLGVTEALINRLSRVESLRVEPLARVRRFDAVDEDPLAAGGRLRSDMVVEGHFQQTAGKVLVRWRLLRTDDGTALAADEWEGDAGSLVHLPGRLASSLVLALGITPSARERERIARTDTSNPEAFRHYLFGRAHLEARSVARAAEAEREFRAALALDPAYARAHAGLALTLTHQAWLGAVRGIDVMEPARQAALEALAHDDSIALAHTALAIVHELFDHDPVSAQAAHMRAMERDDEDLWVLRTYGMFLLRHDGFDEALELSTRTLALDPTSPLSNRHRAQMLYAARRYDECIAISRDTLVLDPHDVSLVLNWLPRCLEALGRRQEAIEARVQSMAAHGAPARGARMMRLFSTRGWDGYWEEERRREDPSDLATALVSVRLGDHDTAIARLERLYEIRHPWLLFTNHAEWDPLRSDPRFQAIRARARLTDEMNLQLARQRTIGTTRAAR